MALNPSNSSSLELLALKGLTYTEWIDFADKCLKFARRLQ